MRTDNVSIIERVAAISETKCSKKRDPIWEIPTFFSPFVLLQSPNSPISIHFMQIFARPLAFCKSAWTYQPFRAPFTRRIAGFPPTPFFLSLSISHSYLVKKTEALGFLWEFGRLSRRPNCNDALLTAEGERLSKGGRNSYRYSERERKGERRKSCRNTLWALTQSSSSSFMS